MKKGGNPTSVVRFQLLFSTKIPLVSMGAKWRVKHEQTGERGPPSAPEFVLAF